MFCHKTSYSHEDTRNRYCGACHMFADPYLNTVSEVPHLITINPDTGLLDLTEEGVHTLTQPEENT